MSPLNDNTIFKIMIKTFSIHIKRGSISVNALVSFARAHTRHYRLLPCSSEASMGQISMGADNIDTGNINKALHGMLGKTLHVLSDMQLPTSTDPLPAPPSIADLHGHLCYVKVMSNTRVVLALQPAYAASQHHLTLFFYECSKDSIRRIPSLNVSYV